MDAAIAVILGLIVGVTLGYFLTKRKKSKTQSGNGGTYRDEKKDAGRDARMK